MLFLFMPFVSPPSDNRTTMPVLTMPFLFHAEKNAFATETIRAVGFNEFLQNAVLHKAIRF